MERKVLFYMQKSTLAPKGGPSAIGFYYLNEKNKRKDATISFLNSSNKLESFHKGEESLMKKMPNWLRSIYSDARLLSAYYRILYGSGRSVNYDISEYDFVFFHSTKNLYFDRKVLKNFHGKVLLQSHSPQPYAQELYVEIPKRLRWALPFLKRRLEKMDIYAFKRADYIIFPCPEAEEPYYNNWSKYRTIKEKKKQSYRYLLTGIPQASAKTTRKELLKKLSIPDDAFIISYVGRHNEVKGYDNLKIIGERLIQDADDNWCVCAGKEYPLKGLDNPRWVEIGWTNEAHSYIAASDVFLLPNKETYFDIVMLEVLSLGKIVVASRTGGNKHFEGEKGVFLYDTIEEAIDIVKRIKMKTSEERKELEQSNLDLYKSKFTVEKMFDRFKALISEL